MSFLALGCALRGRDGFARQREHNVARLPVGKIDRRETTSAGCTDHLKSVPGREFGLTPVVDDEAFHDVLASGVVSANVANSIAHGRPRVTSCAGPKPPRVIAELGKRDKVVGGYANWPVPPARSELRLVTGLLCGERHRGGTGWLTR